MNLNIVRQVRNRTKKVFYGWWVVAANFLVNTFGAGTVFYGFSTFFNPLVAEFGWSRTVVSGAIAISRLEGGIEGPIAGWLIDKVGARKILLIGVVWTAIGFIALWLVNSPLTFYLIFGFLSLGYNLGFNLPPQAMTAKWFIKKRGRALAILMAGNGIGGAIFVPLIAWLIVELGWRWAAMITGLMTLTFVLPMGLIVRSTPEEMGLAPDGQPGRQPPPEGEKQTTGIPPSSIPPEEVDFTVREAIRTKAFWTYVAAMSFRASILSTLVIHQIPHLTDIGIPYQTASNVLGLMALISVPGRFLFGWLGDRFSKKLLIFLACLLQGVGLYIFIHARTLELVYVFIAIYGLGYGGAIPLSIALRADLFGRRRFASIGGIVTPITTITTVAAPLLAGYLYDATKSYSLAFYILLAMIIISGILFLMIPRPSPPLRYLQSTRQA